MMRFVVLCLAIAALVSPALAAKLTLTGQVTYQERMDLPPAATLWVRLVDLSLPQSPTRVIAEAPIASPGVVPLTFSLNFEDAVLTPGHSYALVAEIFSGGKLFFNNTAPLPVDPLTITEPVLIVTRFAGTLETSPVPTPPAILNQFWRAEVISGTPTAFNIKSTLSMGADLRAGGRGGCNSYFSQAALDDTSLRFSAIAATKMECNAIATQQETAFFGALEATRFWRIDGQTLHLSDAAGKTILLFTKD